LIEVIDIFSDQKVVTVRQSFKHRSQRCIRLPLRRTEVGPSAHALQCRWPDPEIAGDRSKRRLCQQVEAAFETSIGDVLLDRADQPNSSRIDVRFLQYCMLRGDGAI